MTLLNVLWSFLLLGHGVLIGWTVAQYLDGVPREGWVTLAVSAGLLCAVSILSDRAVVAVVAAAVAGVYAAMAIRSPGETL